MMRHQEPELHEVLKPGVGSPVKSLGGFESRDVGSSLGCGLSPTLSYMVSVSQMKSEDSGKASAERLSDMPASHRAEDPGIPGPDSPAATVTTGCRCRSAFRACSAAQKPNVRIKR